MNWLEYINNTLDDLDKSFLGESDLNEYLGPISIRIVEELDFDGVEIEEYRIDR